MFENMVARVVIRDLWFFFFFLAGRTGDVPLYTWYNRAQFEDLRTMYLHLHGFLVQHPNIIPKETPNDHSYSLHPQQPAVAVTTLRCIPD